MADDTRTQHILELVKDSVGIARDLAILLGLFLFFTGAIYEETLDSQLGLTESAPPETYFVLSWQVLSKAGGLWSHDLQWWSWTILAIPGLCIIGIVVALVVARQQLRTSAKIPRSAAVAATLSVCVLAFCLFALLARTAQLAGFDRISQLASGCAARVAVRFSPSTAGRYADIQQSFDLSYLTETDDQVVVFLTTQQGGSSSGQPTYSVYHLPKANVDFFLTSHVEDTGNKACRE